MQIDFSKLVDLSYLTDPNPPYQFTWFWPSLIFFMLLISIATFLSVWRLREWQEPYRKQMLAPLWTTGLIGLLLLFARNQSIPYLSARVLLFFTLLAFLIWFGYSFKVARIKSREQKIAFEQQQKLSRYLPRSKR